MSRIDYALRQADGTTASATATVDAVPTLDHYAAENRPAGWAEPDAPRSGAALAPAATRAAAALRALTLALRDDPLTREQYARLAASLDDAAATQQLKTIVVSSAVPREGKTLTVANLAVTLATSYRQRVVAVDADLRRPSLHEVFGLPNETGLADWLEQRTRTLPVVELSSSLALLPAGRAANPMATLATDGLRLLSERLAASFDWILVDTCPVVVSDGQLVARQHGDGVLLVIGAGSTSYRLVQRAIATIGPERIVGTVLNRAGRDHVPASGYYASYYDQAQPQAR
jgi:capsular exopolysaccharide synthesis family protein